MDLKVGSATATDVERAAVDSLLGPAPESAHGAIRDDGTRDPADHFLARGAAGQVDAHVYLTRRSLVEREKRVEAGDAVDLGWRHVETLSDVVDRTPADPSDAVVDCMERW